MKAQIEELIGVPGYTWCDVCPFEPKWNVWVNQNLFIVNWPKDVLNFSNVPFSQATAALQKGVFKY